MKSIKPGRAPSMMSGVMSLLVGVFGVIWTIVAASMGGGIFALFGVVFVVIAIVQAVYSFKNATGENRYSAFDITDGEEEPDPLNERFGASRSVADVSEEPRGDAVRFCPYCGAEASPEFQYCARCGKQLPRT